MDGWSYVYMNECMHWYMDVWMNEKKKKLNILNSHGPRCWCGRWAMWAWQPGDPATWVETKFSQWQTDRRNMLKSIELPSAKWRLGTTSIAHRKIALVQINRANSENSVGETPCQKYVTPLVKCFDKHNCDVKSHNNLIQHYNLNKGSTQIYSAFRWERLGGIVPERKQSEHHEVKTFLTVTDNVRGLEARKTKEKE